MRSVRRCAVLRISRHSSCPRRPRGRATAGRVVESLIPIAAQRFLSPILTHLHSPELMTGLRAAVERLDAAIERKEAILIYGTTTLTARWR